MNSLEFFSQLLSTLICPVGTHLMKDPIRFNCQGEYFFDKKNVNFIKIKNLDVLNIYSRHRPLILTQTHLFFLNF